MKLELTIELAKDDKIILLDLTHSIKTKQNFCY